MPMKEYRVVALCEQAAYFLREDLNLVEGGNLTFALFGTDVTDEHAGRMRATLSRLDEIIEGCGCDYARKETSAPRRARA